RMLGRLLGDTIRDQEGADVFDLVERIRINSVRFHRDANETARRELENTLDELPTVEATRIVRAFSYFSHLANIAEDRHHIRRNRAHMLAGSAPRGGTLAFAIGRVIAAGIESRQLRTWFDTALISPVLTAHPTEVQRKSTMTHEMAGADLLEERDRHDLTEEERDELVDKLHRAVVTLWQTSLLRRTTLTVLDEVANGLSYYDYTFLQEVPQLHLSLEDELAKIDPSPLDTEVGTFLRMGSWIGGDRDGNPFVTAEVLRDAARMHANTALRFYLEELHALGAELSLSTRVVNVSDALAELADRSPDTSPHRVDEPYRRAISGISARVAATLASIEAVTPLPVGKSPPYHSADELKMDLDVIHKSLCDHGSRILAHGRLRRLRRAIDCFGFHLASIDLRQSSAVHERTVAALLEVATPGIGYTTLAENRRVELLAGALATPSLLVSPLVAYSAETRAELAIFQQALDARTAHGENIVGTSIISMAESASDLLELALLLKEVGLVSADGRIDID